MADAFSSRPIELAVYTGSVLLRGSVILPYRRVIDLLNSEDREYISIERATIAPVVHPAQVTGPGTNATVLRRDRVALAGLTAEQSAPLPDDTTAQRAVRAPCLGFLGAYVFHAHFQLMRGQRLIDVMEAQRSDFILFYDATLYLAERPDLPPHQHAGLVVNRHMLDILYLL
jgi:hypothetical protein